MEIDRWYAWVFYKPYIASYGTSLYILERESRKSEQKKSCFALSNSLLLLLPDQNNCLLYWHICLPRLNLALVLFQSLFLSIIVASSFLFNAHVYYYLYYSMLAL